MRFIINRYKWICGVFAVVLFLCNCYAIWTAFHDTEKTAKVCTDEDFYAEIEAETDEAVPAGSDAAVLDESDGKSEKNTDIYTETNEEAKTNVNTNAETDLLKQFSTDDWRLILVNKRHRIPEGYTFEIGTVETPKGRMTCDERIADELSKMLEDAKDEGIRLIIISPYRSIAHQKYLFNRKMRNYMKQGESYMSSYYQTAQTVTIPGSSEHQIGLAMDITSEKYDSLNEGFGESEAGIWLAENCWKYGFVVRYPAGKENITGIEYEPWHFRYVGKEAAEYMTKQGLCLEEFIELLEDTE